MSLLLVSYISASSSYHILADTLCSKSFLLRIIKVMTLHADGKERMLACLFRLVLVVSCIWPLLNSVQLWVSILGSDQFVSYFSLCQSSQELRFLPLATLLLEFFPCWGSLWRASQLSPSFLPPEWQIPRSPLPQTIYYKLRALALGFHSWVYDSTNPRLADSVTTKWFTHKQQPHSLWGWALCLCKITHSRMSKILGSTGKW